MPGTLSLFDAKTEATQLAYDLRNVLHKKLAKKARNPLSETISAAHAVIVIIAYFSVMDEVDLPLGLADLDLSREEQLRLRRVEIFLQRSGRTAQDLLRRADLVARQMMDVTDLLPRPHRPFEAVQVDLLSYYAGLSRRLLHFMPGLAVWERLSETRRGVLRTIWATIFRSALSSAMRSFHPARHGRSGVRILGVSHRPLSHAG